MHGSGLCFNPRAPRGARRLRHAGSSKSKSFNPRAPRGARPADQCPLRTSMMFQSTCPARGTTGAPHRRHRQLGFQSTCPARGTTRGSYQADDWRDCFNPRAPRGARPLASALSMTFRGFNPRAPRGARRRGLRCWRSRSVSIHVPRAGHDLVRAFRRGYLEVSIHVPRAGHDGRRCQHDTSR